MHMIRIRTRAEFQILDRRCICAEQQHLLWSKYVHHSVQRKSRLSRIVKIRVAAKPMCVCPARVQQDGVANFDIVHAHSLMLQYIPHHITIHLKCFRQHLHSDKARHVQQDSTRYQRRQLIHSNVAQAMFLYDIAASEAVEKQVIALIAVFSVHIKEMTEAVKLSATVTDRGGHQALIQVSKPDAADWIIVLVKLVIIRGNTESPCRVS
mmetsp:Transcript_5112/g.8617  ORF Transcript_5112/g.8617 Transcript_5112/m.8617 type:complete len:209 (+) Transcript_5112:280-906(+)